MTPQMFKSTCWAVIIGFALLIGCALPTYGQHEEYVSPNANLVAEGIPKIPKNVATNLEAYTNAGGLPHAGWNPSKRELWVKGVGSNEAWISRITRPGAELETFLKVKADGDIYDVYFHPRATHIIYNTSVGGNEKFQFYLYDVASGTSRRLTEGESRNTEPVWSHEGDKIVYSTSPPDSRGVDLALLMPFDTQSKPKVIAQGNGNYLLAKDWSPDDRFVLYTEEVSRNVHSRLWMQDVLTGERTLLSAPDADDKSYYDNPLFGRDGKGVYLITDRNSEFRQLAYIDLATKNYRYLSADIPWDVEELALSPDGQTLAFTVNEDGTSRLYLLATVTGARKQVSTTPAGVISRLAWHENSLDLVFEVQAARMPQDLYVLNAASGEVERWYKSYSEGVDLDKFPIPEKIHWKSFDGKTISGLLYRPPASFTGPRPVIIDMHGGPEDQARPVYLADANYFING